MFVGSGEGLSEATYLRVTTYSSAVQDDLERRKKRYWVCVTKTKVEKTKGEQKKRKE